MPDGIPTWEEIARDHGRFLYTVAYRLAGSDADAQDLAQEALLRVRRGLETYSPGSLEAWLARIVTNVFLDEVRRRRRRPSTALPDEPDLVLPPTAPPTRRARRSRTRYRTRSWRCPRSSGSRGRALRRRRLVVRRDRGHPGHPGRHRALAHPPRPPPAPDGAVVSSQFDSGLPEDLISAYLDAECSESERAAVAARLALRQPSGKRCSWKSAPPATPCGRCRRSNRPPGSSSSSSMRMPRNGHAGTAPAGRARSPVSPPSPRSLPASCWRRPSTTTRGVVPTYRDAGRFSRCDRLAAVGPGQRLGAHRGDARVDGAAAVKRKLLLAGGAIGLLVLAIAVAAGADEAGDSGSEWSGVIDEARHQMESQAFDGVVVVEWHDPSGVHRTQMEVRQHGGMVEVVNADRTVASDSSSVMLDGQAWTMLSRVKEGGAVPDLTRREVRSRAQYRSRDRGSGDDALRGEAQRSRRRATVRAGRDGPGAPARSARRRRRGRALGLVHARERGDRTVRAAVDGGPATRARAGRSPRTAVSRSRECRQRLPVARSVGTRRRSRELYYTDGVLSVSVFEQPGRLDWSVLPRDGDAVEIGGRPARRYALPVGEAWVFERGGVVYTCVGDAPADEVAAIAADVSAPEPSRGRCSRTRRRPVQLVVERPRVDGHAETAAVRPVAQK